MRVFSYKKIREFSQLYPGAKEPLDKWYKAAERAAWKNLADVRKELPHADAVRDCTVFNIGGNKYRLIVKIEYVKQMIFIKFILTYKEYDKEQWKNAC
jgi:mRNA interferase HigB